MLEAAATVGAHDDKIHTALCRFPDDGASGTPHDDVGLERDRRLIARRERTEPLLGFRSELIA